MARRDRQDQDRRGRVEHVHRDAAESHDPEPPDDREQRRHQRQHQALDRPERLVVDQTRDENGEREQESHPLGILLELVEEDGKAADRDLHGIVALAVHDRPDLLHDRPEAALALGTLELRDDRHGALVLGHDCVEVGGIRAHRPPERVDRLRRLRHRLHQRPHRHSVRGSGDVLGFPRRQAQHVALHDAGCADERGGDPLDLGQHLGLEGIAVLRRDADGDHVSRPEHLLDEVRRQHVGMLLRQHRVRVDDDLQVPDLHQERHGGEQGEADDDEPAPDDPLYVGPHHGLLAVAGHVSSTLLQDRPPFACGAVPRRNSPRLRDRSG